MTVRKSRARAKDTAAARTEYYGSVVTEELIAALRFEQASALRQERAIETRGRIISAALELFSAKGYNGVSTHEIAAKAEVTQGLITYHFKSKEGLWKASMDTLFGSFRNELAQRMYELREVSEALFLKLVIRHYLRWAAQYPFIVRFMIEEGRDPGPRLRWLIKSHISPIYQTITHLIESGQREKHIRPGSVLNIYYQLMGSAMIFCLADEIKILAGQHVLAPEFIEEHANSLINMLFVEDELKEG